MIIFLIFYIICSFIVASLALVELFSNDEYMSLDDVCGNAGLSLLLGVLCPITIWVTLIRWHRMKKTPAWAKALIEMYNLIRRKRS